MKKIFWIALAIFTITTMPSCFIDVNDDDSFFGCVDGSGPLVTEELNVSSFTGIQLEVPAKVYVKQGPVQEVIVEGKENIIDELELDVRNGVWDIETRDCVRDLGDMKFYITIPDIDALRLAGSGEIVSDNVLEVNDIGLLISGSGNMDIALDADDIEARISGSGNMYLEGTADELDFTISGSGNYRGFNLETRAATIEIIGSGDAEVRVTEILNVRITGSGDVFYKGDPETVNVEISGSGQVIDAN